MKRQTSLALLTAFLFVCGLATAPAWANWASVTGSGLLASTVCLLTGGTSCTMTGQTIYSGVTTDITTGTNENLTILPNGNGYTDIGSKLVIRNATAANLSVGSAGAAFFSVDSTAAIYNTQIAAGNFGTDGQAFQRIVWGFLAKTITSPTDTTTAPVCTHCTLTTSGAAAWTPSETGALTGECMQAVNLSTNVITMTDSAGVYEGGAVACALGQYDTVTACYVTDRWIEFGCNNN